MNKKKTIIISIIAVVIILAIIIGLIVFGGKDTKSKNKEQPTTTKQQETTTEKETSTEKESESLTEQVTETTSEVETTTAEPTTEEQSKDNEVIESGDNEQLIPAGHEKYFYVQCGMRIGWNDSAKMGYEAGDYFYVANNGDIYYFSSEADKNSFDSSNPNKAFLFYVEGTGLVGGSSGEAHTIQPTEPLTQQPTTQGGSHNNTEQETTLSEDDWEQGELYDPSKGTWDGTGGFDPNNQ